MLKCDICGQGLIEFDVSPDRVPANATRVPRKCFLCRPCWEEDCQLDWDLRTWEEVEDA